MHADGPLQDLGGELTLDAVLHELFSLHLSVCRLLSIRGLLTVEPAAATPSTLESARVRTQYDVLLRKDIFAIRLLLFSVGGVHTYLQFRSCLSSIRQSLLSCNSLTYIWKERLCVYVYIWESDRVSASASRRETKSRSVCAHTPRALLGASHAGRCRPCQCQAQATQVSATLCTRPRTSLGASHPGLCRPCHRQAQATQVSATLCGTRPRTSLGVSHPCRCHPCQLQVQATQVSATLCIRPRTSHPWRNPGRCRPCQRQAHLLT